MNFKNSSTLKIYPQKNIISNNSITRTCIFSRVDSEKESNPINLWFHIENIAISPEWDNCDSYLIAILMLAMYENRDIIIKGKISRSLLSNLTEFQFAWHKLKPNYHIVNIIPDEIIYNEKQKLTDAICAFSGGVDATFTVWRHTQNLAGYRSFQIKNCCMVHGFDIPLKDELSFNKAFNSAQKTLSTIDINLIKISTNIRTVIKSNWEDSHATALVSALSNFTEIAGYCLIGSSDPYNHLCIPWGSSPLTDHLLGSDTFNVIHDGASHNRTEKVKEISLWKAGTDNLRVCWEGTEKDKNCGYCEKCLRTKINFLACDQHIPKCFPDSKNIRESILNIKLKSEEAKTEWTQIYEYLIENNKNEDWVEAIRLLLNKPLKTKKRKKFLFF